MLVGDPTNRLNENKSTSASQQQPSGSRHMQVPTVFTNPHSTTSHKTAIFICYLVCLRT